MSEHHEELKASIARDKGVPIELLSGTDEETLIAQADLLVEFRGKPVSDQLTQEDLKTMTPAEIVEAHDTGKLNKLLGRPVRAELPTFPSRADLKRMKPEEINQAHREGRLNHLLEGRTIGETK